MLTLFFSMSGGETHHDFPADGTLEEKVSRLIEERAATPAEQIYCAGELLCGSAILPQFYARRGFRSAWFRGDSLNGQAYSMIEFLLSAEKEGLKAANYHSARIEELAADIDLLRKRRADLTAGLGTDLEMLLTDAFLLYGSNLLSGLVNPETIKAEWFIKSREMDLPALLQQALDSHAIADSLQKLPPQHDAYTNLRGALAKYRNLAYKGPWPQVPSGETIIPGAQDPRVTALRKRLQASGDMPEQDAIPDDIFDEDLEKAVKNFQIRQGLDADGRVGKNTLAALNVPLEARIRQLVVNLERWRWLPSSFGENYILVNIANFELDIFEQGKITLNMRVVVGNNNRKTPVFTEKMTYLEINPYWTIPELLAVEDKLPKILKDPEYLKKQGIRVFDGWSEVAKELDPQTVDWGSLGPGRFPFRLRQDPGPLNALGRIKFMFPNRFAVYLHDTPDKAYFSQSMRGFSSGCIRVERPLELAAYLLREDPEWTSEQIQARIESGERTIIHLRDPVPVFLIYLTAWADGDGEVHFREDIYNRDDPLYNALMTLPPGNKFSR